MARPAPAARRALDILNFLAAHPTESFTLSELSRRLGLNGASAHAVLAVLEQDGLVVRHRAHKTYGLGPATVALGHAARQRHQVLDLARREMHDLADELPAQVVATVATEDQIVFVDRAGRYAGRDPSPRVGERVPLAPPRGTVFMAWAGAPAVEAWIDRRGPQTSPEERAALGASLEWTRARGYAVGFAAESVVELAHALIRLSDRADDAPRRARLEPLAAHHAGSSDRRGEPAQGGLAVSEVAAPVFGPAGEVTLALVAIGFETALGPSAIRDVGTRLRRSAAATTAAINGRAPAA